MAIRKTKTQQARTAPRQGTVRLTGSESLADVAEKLFQDKRIASLLGDLNPQLGNGKLRAGTQVVVPSRQAAQRFAAKMGFSLGFDPAKGGSTKAKRNWAKMKAGSAGGGAQNDPADLARLFAGQGVALEQGAKRIIALASAEAVDAFVAASDNDEVLAPMRRAVQAQLDLLWLRPRMKNLARAIEATKAPKGRARFYDAVNANTGDAHDALTALLVPAPVTQAVLKSACSLSNWGRAAKAVARSDESMRDTIAADAGLTETAMKALVDAYVDDVDPFTDARVDALGFSGARAAFDKHLDMLHKTVKTLLEHIGKTSPDTLRKACNGDASVPKPWPVLVTLFTRLGDKLERLSAANAERGLAALIVGAEAQLEDSGKIGIAGPQFTAAQLAHQAARVAKVADDHDGVPERFAPICAKLFALYRPLPKQGGTEAQIKSKRRTRAEKSVLSPKGTRFVPDVCTSVLEEVIDLATESDDAGMKRSALRFKRAAKRGALALAKSFSEPLNLLMRSASPVGKAILVGAIALDPELGPALARDSGREAAMALISRHGTRTLTLAISKYTDDDMS